MVVSCRAASWDGTLAEQSSFVPRPLPGSWWGARRTTSAFVLPSVLFASPCLRPRLCPPSSRAAADACPLRRAAPHIAVNDPPSGQALTTSTDEQLTIVIVTGPTNGELSPSTPGEGETTITYTPGANFNGQDSFTYYVKDPSNADSQQSPATVSITVNAGKPPAPP